MHAEKYWVWPEYEATKIYAYVMLSSVMALTKIVTGGAMDFSDVRA